LKDAECINKRRIDRFLAKARAPLWTLKDKRIGILGLAFKPETDDIRFAPAMELIRGLIQESAQLQVYDPQAMEKTKALFPSIRYCDTAYAAAENAEALMIATEWPLFRSLDWKLIHQSMSRPLILDGRNLLDGQEMRALGFEYQGIGKPIEEAVDLKVGHAL
jgi:UDPglucose 6-dehydrogenase